MLKIDINCDMGEGFGVYDIGINTEIFNYITSANIACGFHAGDPNVMQKTVALSLENGVSIGAHPGFLDLIGFGRRELNMKPKEVYNLVVYQIGALQAFVTAEGGKLQHVKPHGALYNMAATNIDFAENIAKAVKDVDDTLILFGLANSELTKAGEIQGLQVFHEVFADRTYKKDGTLTPRTDKRAIITDHHEAINQVMKMVHQGIVYTHEGEKVSIKADTVCIHGDHPHAFLFAQKLKMALSQ